MKSSFYKGIKWAKEQSNQWRYEALSQYRSLISPSDALTDLFIFSSSGNSHGLSYPFHFYKEELREKLGLNIHEFSMDDLRSKAKALDRFEKGIAIVSVPLRKENGNIFPTEEVLDFLKNLKKNDERKIVFFDPSDNPIGMHFDVAPYVDLYCMPFLFSDKSNYNKEFLGGNCFADYFSKTYNLSPVEKNEYHTDLMFSKLPKGEDHKLFSFWNWMFYRRLLHLFQSQNMKCIRTTERPIDVHCRVTPYSGWCKMHRLAVIDSLNKLSNRYEVIASDSKVSVETYYSEIQSSKILFSPFGWGECCPKDYEAVMKGCLLMKPSVEHVTALPEFYKPFETYVPVAWDLSDLHEKVEYYLNHEDERNVIINNASLKYESLMNQNGFLNIVEKLLEKLDDRAS